MFESAELGHEISKAEYKAALPELREQLLQAQFELVESARFPVFIVVSGVDGAGKGETIKVLNEWMDPRHVQTNAMYDPTTEERERPYMWRFWRVFPPKGEVGIFVHSWYSEHLLNRVYNRYSDSELDQAMERIVRFERMLTNEGALILKFWLHLSRDGQEERFKALEKDPANAWRVGKQDWKHLKMYDKFITVTERMLRLTSTSPAPWIIVEGADARYRDLTIGRTVLQSLRSRLDFKEKRQATNQTPSVPMVDNLNVLRSLDLTKSLEKKDYRKQLAKYQRELAILTRKAKFNDISVVAMFEGNDAAGKGGSIRRITGALDPRVYRVIPIAAPTEEEKAQPYLWRFWRHLPRRGQIAIFDRSWYGRVLVERIEGFCTQGDWMRAYEEINNFEQQIVANGSALVKFWLSVSADEQLARFEAREKTGYKRYKITEDDWRNREKYDQYEQAVCDMVDRTSTEIAPWTLIEANSKYFARVKVLKTLCKAIKDALKAVK